MLDDYSKLTDDELYDSLGKDGRERERAFAEIYARHSKRIYMYCRRVLSNRDAADDIFQETFLRLLLVRKEEKEISNFPAFLLKIARNLCLKTKRDQKSSVSIENFDFGYQDNQLEREETSGIVTSALELLPDEYREALILQTYNNMSYNDISEFLDVPVTTVRNWIVRAKRKIREIIVDYYESRPI